MWIMRIIIIIIIHQTMCNLNVIVQFVYMTYKTAHDAISVKKN